MVSGDGEKQAPCCGNFVDPRFKKLAFTDRDAAEKGV